MIDLEERFVALYTYYQNFKVRIDFPVKNIVRKYFHETLYFYLIFAGILRCNLYVCRFILL